MLDKLTHKNTNIINLTLIGGMFLIFIMYWAIEESSMEVRYERLSEVIKSYRRGEKTETLIAVSKNKYKITFDNSVYSRFKYLDLQKGDSIKVKIT
jgi:hypothetical protein